jgi:hypothetical protein
MALAAVFTLLVTGPISSAEVLPFDVQSYRWSVRVSFEESPGPDSPYRSLFSILNTLDAEATLTVRNASDGPLTDIPLLLHRLMKVTELEIDGEPATFRQELKTVEDWEGYQVRYISVSLEKPWTSGGRVTLRVRYTGQLEGYTETGMLYVQETLDPDFTILRSETFCYPQVAKPRRDAVHLARRRDEFDQELRITVPASHVVVNAGKLTAVEESDGKKTYSFSSHEPDGVILLPIAPYRLVTAGESRIFHFETSSEGAENLARSLEKVMALFTSWFGPTAMERGLTIAEIPELFGSQAGPLIIQTSGSFNDPAKYGEFYHELSHLWNASDVDPKPSRWNEGLAMFLQGLVEEKLGGKKILDRQLSSTFSRLQEKLREDEKLSSLALIDYGEEDYTSWSYSTGALFFGLLHDRVGEDALLEFLGTYYQEHRDEGSTDRVFAEELVAELGPVSEKIVQEWFLTPAFCRKVLAAASWDELRAGYRSGPS